MNPDRFIEEAITQGKQLGIASLDSLQRHVFLISEPEVIGDMNGIDSFIDRYAPTWLPEAATAFEFIGAFSIAAEIRAYISHSDEREPILERLNELITKRVGYDYGKIVLAVAKAQLG